MSRASAVKKKPVAKAGKAVTSAKKAAPAKARAPAKNAAAKAAKTAKTAKAAPPAKAAPKPAPKPSPKLAPKPAPKPAPRPVARSSPAAAAPKTEQRFAGLSEAEVLRAPASQYMNATQLAFFRERLHAMQRELLEKADVTSEHLREHDIEADPTDQATIEEEYALELRARDRERKLLKKIEQALRRIEDGSYGYCEETGEPIGIPRLLARPTATLTIEAQSRRELKQKLYGD